MTSRRGVTPPGARRGGRGARAAARRWRRRAARGTATAGRSARRSSGASRGARTAGGWRRTRRSARRAARTRARARPRAASDSRPGSRTAARACRARARPLRSTPRSRPGASSRVSVVSTGCVTVCGSKRTRPAASAARSSSQPAIGGIPPGAYHGNDGRARDGARDDEDRAREPVLAHHGQGVLEDVAIAVVERERDRRLAWLERHVVDLVEVDHALPAGRERVHLAAERIRRDGERIAIVGDAVVVEDAQAGPRSAAAERAGEHLAAHERGLGQADRARSPCECGKRRHRVPFKSRNRPSARAGWH